MSHLPLKVPATWFVDAASGTNCLTGCPERILREAPIPPWGPDNCFLAAILQQSAQAFIGIKLFKHLQRIGKDILQTYSSANAAGQVHRSQWITRTDKIVIYLCLKKQPKARARRPNASKLKLYIHEFHLLRVGWCNHSSIWSQFRSQPQTTPIFRRVCYTLAHTAKRPKHQGGSICKPSSSWLSLHHKSKVAQ